MVDDAQELGEGELGLLAGCARAGSSVWVFGDPDLATGSFTGERSRVLAGLHEELARRGGLAPGSAQHPEQRAVLSTVYRHGSEVREFVRGLTVRIGAAGAAEHRAAPAVAGGGAAEASAGSAVQFATASSPAEQLGIIAHRLRARRLGLGGVQPVDWTDMAVICRTRGEASRVARLLAVHQVPTGIAAGGVVLREHQIVRELIRMLQHTLRIRALGADEVLQLVGGVIGGLDPVAIRRLRGALLMHERRTARQEGREPRSIDAVVADGFAVPGVEAIVDSAGGRALRRLGKIAAAADSIASSGGTAREVLWAIWDGTGLAGRWQREALEGRGARADEAHRSLDAVMGLFFALQRHEEQDSEQPIAELLEELSLSAVPEDSLAQQSQREAVTVTTPQGVIGREFEVVAVVGAQDGSWPNLRARGSLLGATSLERWLRGEEATAPSRRDTVHDELRLFVHSCARARDALLVVAIADEDQHPSAFFGFGRAHLVTGLPSARLTLRGATSEMRRRLNIDPGDASALRSLVALAAEGVPGAHPDEWYGVLEPSTTAPIVDLVADPAARVSVSPSQLERAEECPLDWVVSSLGGGGGSVQASLGTLIHHALETAQDTDAAALFETVLAQWHKLPFDADWESQRTKRVAEQMTESLAEYLRDFAGSDRELLAQEAAFEIPLEHAVLRGFADRLEMRRSGDDSAHGGAEITVVDLKTGRTPPSAAATATHAQLQAYQLGVMLGAFESAAGLEGARSGGAKLLYVHPDATKRGGYVERGQEPMSEDAKAALIERVTTVARVMAANEFTARVEHHCSDPHKPGSCRLHIIQAVSHA
ncbi:ATP-dependent helicase [Leucobacter insecticola]|uniref:ATP-dependent helicase n=1 Tax=Leucobacter insecticola TaxID=2714934 RepID=A0A6G8FK40_9MICO|nr:PD-(D/E)XK nuclease family protein [Leucobacter insecticola]QIM16806.1 ATP-dependent helicase [Leucobacter insecticola]